ncbi:hypothetical protein ABZ619_18735 [Streptomyces sp. NPDC007851]|uniref:hypothetical protein n=1 Tax=Streptomyces sp. NPDC007851 TaxID=3155008 RepID=UPI0033C5398C
MPRFDVVTTVPSTSGRPTHPLRALVADMVGATRDRHRDLLRATPRAADLGRTASSGRCTASALWGEHVLLVDDILLQVCDHRQEGSGAHRCDDDVASRGVRRPFAAVRTVR